MFSLLFNPLTPIDRLQMRPEQSSNCRSFDGNYFARRARMNESQ